ncbi:unnamed protein product [Arabis nemorensis]|uniref:Uncharacterized protein n=1 Tax=Arabis nemorensis TaxID=586526 RepID=A0A565CCW3_9BRAS|nr:unnamed protein product [Arabis nemorensis]
MDDSKRMERFQSMFSLKEKDMNSQKELSMMSLLDNLLAKKELSEKEEAKQHTQLEKDLTRKELDMQDLKNSVAAETKASPTSSVNELHLEIMEKNHYENVMKDKVLPDIKEAKAKYEELATNWQLASNLSCEQRRE